MMLSKLYDKTHADLGVVVVSSFLMLAIIGLSLQYLYEQESNVLGIILDLVSIIIIGEILFFIDKQDKKKDYKEMYFVVLKKIENIFEAGIYFTIVFWIYEGVTYLSVERLLKIARGIGITIGILLLIICAIILITLWFKINQKIKLWQYNEK